MSTSWMSRLPPACKPPEIMLTMGSGNVGDGTGRTFARPTRVNSPESCSNERTVIRRARRPPHAPPPGKRRAAHWPRAGSCWSAVERDQPGIEAAIDRPDPCRRRPGRSRASRCSTALATPSPPYRWSSVSRSSSASCRPVLAPEGTIALPTAPLTRPHPPRLSAGRASRAPGGPSALSGLPLHSSADRVVENAVHNSSQVAGPVSRASRAKRPCDCLLPRVEVLDGALAVDPRQRSMPPRAGWPDGPVPIETAGPSLCDPDRRPRRAESAPRSDGEPVDRSTRSTDRLEQEMAQKEAQVERRVARVGTLEIEQNQAFECTRMFFGLKSPRTSVRSAAGRSMAAIKASMPRARSGCARAAVR